MLFPIAPSVIQADPVCFDDAWINHGHPSAQSAPFWSAGMRVHHGEADSSMPLTSSNAPYLRGRHHYQLARLTAAQILLIAWLPNGDPGREKQYCCSAC